MSTVIQLAIVLGIMVLVHELGHFIVAKLCRVRVEVFSIGFGTRLFGFKRGDTDYRLSLLPLGGYVKMSGEMPGEEKSDDPGELENHPRWQRVLIALAGPVFNFLLAIALMTGVYMVHNEVQAYLNGPAHVDYVSLNTPAAHTGIQGGDTIVHYDTVENPTWDQVAIRSLLNLNQTISFSYVHDGQRTNTKLFVEAKGGAEDFALDNLGFIPLRQDSPIEVSSLEGEENLPAARAGMKPGDQLESIDGLHLHSVYSLHAYLQDTAGKPVSLVVNRHGDTLPIHLTPVLGDAGDGTKYFQLGFLPVQPPVKVQRLPFGKAMVASWQFNKKSSLLIVEVVKRMFTRQVSVRSLSGPIGIGQQVHQAMEMQGWTPIVGLMAYISINLGILNLLPIPILDGGMILFLIIESIIRRDVNQQLKERVYQVAFVCIIIFAAFIIFNDITKLSIFTKVKP
ncbi:MAG TPA: RIP metalloprotease RseP [Edaphobacter sp.]|uniref:RIP metalloprotease RseP n=1 Tax=Edaphobacter sp. TaxID=1934404 RepID=UPI002BD576A5|nr:RIP metalloprotease RseP [Edaphobacter sp.]HUZ94857.1 RIP metalloprotease RseP [Edaphobacter sp.]